MTIIDNIVGEMIGGLDRMSAIEEAERRVKYHNSEFCYEHRGKHYCANAIMEINNNTITIKNNGGKDNETM